MSNLPPDEFLRRRYGQMWSDSIERIRAGNVDIDPSLALRVSDRRRAMTVLFRPPARVQQRVSEFMEALRALEPDQYYYHPAELHLTFLSPFTATVEHERLYDRTADYIDAVSASVARLASYPISFAGVTASPAAILVQGFTYSTRLNAGRDIMRQELRSRGLTEGLDSRYRLESAHMTVARFAQPLRNAPAFMQALEKWHGFDFAESPGDALELVKNDWYMTRAQTHLLRSYQLTAPA